jgi:single-stranded DNA-binding protein
VAEHSERNDLVIDALIQGRIHGQPARRESANNGNPYVVAKLRTTARDGTVHFVNVIAFDESAMNVLLALGDGDSAAISGELTPKTWTPRDGGEPRVSLDLLAHAAVSPYHVQRKRQATAGEVL